MRVFISSTFEDLKEHRETLIQELSRMKIGFSSMEYFGSRTDQSLPVCKSEIDECDLFIGIYAWCYGWQPDKDGVSITEAEFDYARAQEKRCLCYLIDENHPWQPMLVDSPESEPGRRLKEFKEKVSRLVRSKFTTPDNLARQIAADLAREISQQGLSGTTAVSASPSLERIYCLKLAAELIKDKESTAHYVRLEGNDGIEATFDLEQRFFDWLGLPDEGMLAILADAGSGKTTFCRHLCHKLASEWSESSVSFLPVLIPLRRYRSSATLSDMLNAEFRRLGGISSELSNYSKLVIFLDGLDEQAERFSDDETSRRLFEVRETIPPESKVVLTCRTHFFRDRNVESKLLEKPNPFSTGLQLGRTKSIPIFYVLPFKEQQKEEYLRKTQGDAWQDMADTINKIYDLKDLSSRPILLNLITNLLPELRKTKGPVGERRLYDIAVDSWLERERWRGIQSEDVRGFLESIALEMMKKSGNNHSIHHRDLQSHVMEHFRTRILSVVDLEAWDGMVRTSLFLNRDSDGNYAFMHRSFMEYFVADKIFRDWKNRKYDEVESIEYFTDEVKTFLKPLFSPTNIEILYFAVEDWKHFYNSYIAGIFLSELPFPIPFGADSEHIDRLIESAVNSHNMYPIEACLKVIVDLKIVRAIPELFLGIEKHSGDGSQRAFLETIVEIGDQSAIPKLIAIRRKVAEDVDYFRQTYGPHYERLKVRNSRTNDEFYEHDVRWLNDLKMQLMRANAEDIVLDTIVWSYVEPYDRNKMWGFSCRDIDVAISKILHGPVESQGH